jgi:hypothetical protein
MKDALKYAEQIAYSSKEVLKFTYDMAVKYKDTPGVYVECGVAAGAQIIAMAAGAPNKTIYAFDSFEGIPLPSNKDDQMPGIKMLTKEEQEALPNPGKQVLESSGATIVSEVDFWDHIDAAFDTGSRLKYTNIITIPGWFEETVPFSVSRWEHSEKILGHKFGISILRLDGDLYNSTYVCLKYLYPKVIKGGIVIIDDYALPGCRAAVLDYFGMSVPDDVRLMHSGESTIAYWERKHAGRQ